MSSSSCPSSQHPSAVAATASRLQLPRSASLSLQSHHASPSSTGGQRGRIARSVSAKSDLSLAATSNGLQDVPPTLEATAARRQDGTITAGYAPSIASSTGSGKKKGKGRQVDPLSTPPRAEGIKSRDYGIPHLGEDEAEDANSREGSPTEDEDSDDDTAEDELVMRPSETDADPRTMLREQLRRSESVRASSTIVGNLSLPSRSRAQSYRSGTSVPRSVTEAQGRFYRRSRLSIIFKLILARYFIDKTEESPTVQSHIGDNSLLMPLRPRRYLVLTSAGKPVFAR